MFKKINNVECFYIVIHINPFLNFDICVIKIKNKFLTKTFNFFWFYKLKLL